MTKNQKKKIKKLERKVDLRKASDRVPTGPMRPTQRVSGGPQVLLSGCAKDYARALVNPFNGPLACVPSFPVLMTRKVRNWVRGTFSTGTNSNGFIAADPQTSGINNLNCVYASTSAYASTTVILAGGADVAGYQSNSEYVSTGVGANLSLYKVVGSGLRFRYTGTSLNSGGTIVALSDPNHNSLVGRTYANFQAELVSKQFTFGREWINILYKPVIESELNAQTSIPANTGAATDPCFYMGAYINSAVASQPFEFEFYTVLEWEGANIRGQTPSHADPAGFAAIQTASLQSPTTVPKVGNDPTKHESTFLQEAGRALLQTGSTIVGNFLTNGVRDVVSFVNSPVGKTALTLGGEALALL